jgi:chromate transporter
MRAVFYGVGAAVTGIIAISSYKLTTKSISRLNPEQIRRHWMLWTIFLTGLVVTIVTRSENIWWLMGLGLAYMFIKAPPGWFQTKRSSVPSLFLWGFGFWNTSPGTLEKIGWFFFKAGAFVFGSGLAIVPFLHGGVVEEHHWLTESEFLDAVAVAMITPGPVVITVGFIGYLIAGFPGAVIASLATFLPCYLFTVIPAPHFKRIAGNRSIKAFIDGITAAVIGSLTGAVVIIALRSVYDWPTGFLAVLSCITLIYFKKIKEPYIILVAAAAGLILKMVVH